MAHLFLKCALIALLFDTTWAFSRHVVPATMVAGEEKHIQVLLWNKIATPELISASDCSSTCHVSSEHTRLPSADVVVFTLGEDEEPLSLPERAKRSQRFVAYFDAPISRVSELQDPGLLGDLDGEISYRLSADVWLSPLHFQPVALLDFPASYKTSQSSSSFVLYDESECTTSSHRDSFVKQLMKHVPVDSIGQCLNNKNRTFAESDRVSEMAQYDFTLILEADMGIDFVSARIYEALKAGSVPIYAGAKNIDEFLPVSASSCIIKASDFNSTLHLANHLNELHSNPLALRELTEWKARGLSSKFVHAAQQSKAQAMCRLCDWARTTSEPHHPSAVAPQDAMPSTLLSASRLLDTADMLQRNILISDNSGGMLAFSDCVNNCSSRGECVERQCVCRKGWRGFDCSIEDGKCPNNCSRHGLCIEEVCLCDDGWIGEGCERIDPRLQWQCEVYCGERGVCVNGVCRCAEGYCGDDCSLLIGSCVNNCSGHGKCCDSRCLCDRGWWGDRSCSTQGPSCPFDFDCNDHGTCLEGKCACDNGYTDFDCSESVAAIEALRRPGPAVKPQVNPCPFNCSGHGACIAATGCDCSAGWDGKACDIERETSCPVDYDCANGGQCVNGRCVGCKAGYTGFDCRTEPHPVVARPPQQSMGERGNLILFAPKPTNNNPPELQGRAMLKSHFNAPPAIFLQSNDELPQSIAVASVAITHKPHKFLADGRPDKDPNAQFPTEAESFVVIAATQTLPRAVYESMAADTLSPEVNNVTLPLPLQPYKDRLIQRPFSFVAIEQGIWRLEGGSLMIAGSAPICQMTPEGRMFEWHENNRLRVTFPRRFVSKRPIVTVGLMSPVLSAPLPGIVGVLRVEQVTLTDFTVLLPPGLCDTIRQSRSLATESTLQMMMQMEEGAYPGDNEWGDDIQEYLSGQCTRVPAPPGPPTNPYAFEFRDYSGVPASQRPCSEPAFDPDVVDKTANVTGDIGYGPNQSAIENENKYPDLKGVAAANVPPKQLAAQPPGFGKLTLSYLAIPSGVDSFQGGIRIHAVVADVPVTPELIPMDIDLGYETESSDTDAVKRPTKPHPGAMMKNLTSLTSSREIMQQNPETGAWEYVYMPPTEEDFPSTCVLSTVLDPSNKQALSIVFRPGRELEISVTEDIVDDIVVRPDSMHHLLNDLVLLQSAESASLSATGNTTNTTSTNTTAYQPVNQVVPMGEALRVILKVPNAQRSDMIKVALSRVYEDGVAIAEPLTKSTLLNEPMVSVVHGVKNNELIISLVKPSLYATSGQTANTTSEVTEKVNVIVMDTGVYETTSSRIIVGKVSTDSINPHTGWIQINFSVPFARVPVVLSQVQSYNVPNASTPLPFLKTRHSSITTTGFLLSIEGESETFVEKFGDSALLGQIIGIIAIDAGPTTLDTWTNVKVSADATASVMFDNWFSINFAQTMVASISTSPVSTPSTMGYAPIDPSTAPIFVGHTKTYNNDRPCHARIRNLLGDAVDVKIESDDLASPRTADEKEGFGYFVVSAASILKTSRHALFPNGSNVVTAGLTTLGLSGPALFKSFSKLPLASASKTCPGNPPCNNHGKCNDTTGVCECDGFWSGIACQTADRLFIGENGRATIELQYKRQLHTINLQRTYQSPVVFVSPVTRSGDIPLLPRVARVTSSSFTVFLEQPHTWMGGPTNVNGPESFMYMVLEQGIWKLDDAGNTIEVSSVVTKAAAGIESASVAFKRTRGSSAIEGRRTLPVLFTQTQTANNPVMVHSVVTGLASNHAGIALEAERVIQPTNTSNPQLSVVPDVSNAVRLLRLSTSGAVDGKLSGVLTFDPPATVTNNSKIEFMFAANRNMSSAIGIPFGALASISNVTFSYSFSAINQPAAARYILVVTRPLVGNPAFVPILANDDNPYYPQPIPFSVDIDNFPLLEETVGLLAMSAGMGTWDNKTYVANTKARLNQPQILQWVDFLDPQSQLPYPLVTLTSTPLAYLAAIDFDVSMTGAIPSHVSLGASLAESVDKSSAKIRLDVENKRDRGKELPSNLTLSYFGMVLEGLLSATDAGCPKSCSSGGACVNHMCVCDSLHAGEDCSQVVDPALCNPKCPSDRSRCVNSKCVCVNGLSGANCDISVADLNPSPSIEQLCPRNCSGHGTCNGVKCMCDGAWSGSDCGTPICIGGCNEPYGGTCVSGKCVCANTYTGGSCQGRTCYPDPTCHNNGVCVNGTCLCSSGWRGADCTDQIPPLVCPGQCSGHGKCGNGICTCDDGYEGLDCGKLKVCPIGTFMGVQEQCTGHGWCNKGVCVCSEGWIGLACSEISSNWNPDCPFNCSGRGLCTPLGCMCDDPFGGRGCRQMKEAALEMGEVISVIVSLSAKSPVQKVFFSRRFVSPIVIANPPSRSNPNPFSVQIMGIGHDHCNISSTQAQLAAMRTQLSAPSLRLQTQSLSYLAPSADDNGRSVPALDEDWKVEEMLTLVVIEEGSWDLRNGLLVHAGKIPVSKIRESHGAYTQGFPRYFSEQPAVLAQTQSVQSHILARSRIRSSKIKSFVVGMDLVNGTLLAPEELWASIDGDVDFDVPKKTPTLDIDGVNVGWFAVGPSTSSFLSSPDPFLRFKFGARGFYYGVRMISIDKEWNRVPFNSSAKIANPRVIADSAYASAHTLRFHALSSTGVSLGLENTNGTLVIEPSHACMFSVIAFDSEGPLSAHPLQCPDKCGYDGERGMCDKSKCICEKGWAGLTCKVPATTCLNGCSNHGTCTAAGCRCKTGWVGFDCSMEVPQVRIELIAFAGVGDMMGAKVAECEDNCSGHGTCLKGVCNCTDSNWIGFKCHLPNPCVRQCSGHGQCMEGEGCMCDGGWGGVACDEPSLMCPFDYDCGEGQCVEGKCQCDSAHFGFNCRRMISDPSSYQSNNGQEPDIPDWQKAAVA